jgi:hypothetical protein
MKDSNFFHPTSYSLSFVKKLFHLPSFAFGLKPCIFDLEFQFETIISLLKFLNISKMTSLLNDWLQDYKIFIFNFFCCDKINMHLTLLKSNFVLAFFQAHEQLHHNKRHTNDL